MGHSNYMQVLPGGHCFICHKDFDEMSNEHPCFKDPNGVPTACGEECKDSKYKMRPYGKSASLIIHNDPSEDNVCDGCQ